MSKEFKYQGERPEDIFEAISVMAKRARQINEKRASTFTLNSYTIDGEEEYELEKEIDNESFNKLEKATTIAMREFSESKLEYDYDEGAEEELESITDDEEDLLI